MNGKVGRGSDEDEDEDDRGVMLIME